MGDIVMNLAIEYAKARGLNKITDEALAYAYETLGIEKEEEEEYTGGGIYGMKNAFSPKNLMQSLGRNVLSGAAKKAVSSSGLSGMIGPGLLLGGALMLGRAFDPTREGSRNYNPELQGQIDYALGKGLIGTNSGSGLQQYNTNSVLSGQNVQSLFGTNDYAKQLQNHIDKYGDKDGKGQAELENLTTDEFDKVDAFMETLSTNNSGSGNGNGGGKQSPGAPGAPSHSTRDLMAKGGITNVNMNKGQLGEQLRG